MILCGDQPPLSPCHFAPTGTYVWDADNFPRYITPWTPVCPIHVIVPHLLCLILTIWICSWVGIQWKYSHFHFVIGCVEADADEDDFLDRVSESAPVQCGWPWWHPDDSPAHAYYPHCSVVTPGCRAPYARERQRRADKKCTELVARIHLRLPERLCSCCLSANGTRPLMFLSTATCLSTIASNNACLHPDHL